MKEKLAEERSRETARRAQEQQRLEALARLRRLKEEEAERRSEEVVRRNCAEMDRAAVERLGAALREEKLAALRSDWARLREGAEKRAVEPKENGGRCCGNVHPRHGWRKRRARAVCVFCGRAVVKFHFVCPNELCAVAACKPCKDKVSFVSFGRHPGRD